MNNLIEGVDYIVDHYAVLGLDPQADADAVHKAIREMRARNHPDRLGRASDEILRIAQRQTDLANRAAAVLEDPQRRAGYDERLAYFHQHEPHLISTDGHPIVCLSRQYIDVDNLMAGTLLVDTNSEGFQALSQLSGHTPETLARAERLLTALPDDPDTQALARQARIQHWVQCVFDQQVAWTNAGVHNRLDKPDTQDSPFEWAHNTQLYLDQLTTQIIPDRLAQRHHAARLGLAPPLRLLEHQVSARPQDPSEQANPADLVVQTQLAIQAQVLDVFEQRSQAVMQAAEKTQQALTKALELTPFHVFRQAIAGAPIDFILVLGDPHDDATQTPVAALRLMGTTITGSPDHRRDTVGQWKTDETLGRDVTRVFLGHHPDIEPVLSEVWWAAEHLEQLGLAPPHPVSGGDDSS